MPKYKVQFELRTAGLEANPDDLTYPEEWEVVERDAWTNLTEILLVIIEADSETHVRELIEEKYRNPIDIYVSELIDNEEENP